MIIVLAWRSTRIEGLPDAGPLVPKAVLWLRDGTDDDLPEAKAYAERESKTPGQSNWQVYTYPEETGWRKALELAKVEVMK